MNISNKFDPSPKILGLTGTAGSGKDTIASWLNQSYGYFHVSTGDMVREVAQAKFGKTERQVLHKVANKLRQERGSGVLVELALEHYQSQKKQYSNGIVISGIRSIGEARAVHKNNGWLLFVDAPTDLRYKRIHSRARGEENIISFEDFAKRDQLENNPQDNKNENIQNIAKLEEMADEIISNNYELTKFLEELRVLLGLPAKR